MLGELPIYNCVFFCLVGFMLDPYFLSMVHELCVYYKYPFICYVLCKPFPQSIAYLLTSWWFTLRCNAFHVSEFIFLLWLLFVLSASAYSISVNSYLHTLVHMKCFLNFFQIILFFMFFFNIPAIYLLMWYKVGVQLYFSR